MAMLMFLGTVFNRSESFRPSGIAQGEDRQGFSGNGGASRFGKGRIRVQPWSMPSRNTLLIFSIFSEVFHHMKRGSFVRVLLVTALVLGLAAAAGAQTLTVYCGAGLMHPMDDLKARFEKTHPDTTLQMVYAGSGELFGMIATRKEGDVFIPGADKYTRDALNKGFITEDSIRDLCFHVPVILVPAANPGNVQALDDLAREGLRVGLADAKAAAIGKVGMAILKKNNLTEPVLANCVVKPSTTNQLLIYTATGQVDAVIAWEDQALWGQAKGKVAVVHIPTKQNVIKTIPAAVVSFSEQKELSQELVDYISSREGKGVWAEWGFPVTKPE